MFEIRIHGRGGQGVVTAAELLALAAFDSGRYAQAFPSFGSERTGAPVVAFCRIDDRPIRTREPISDPDALVIQDPTLLHESAVFEGLRRGGYIVINTERDIAGLGLAELDLYVPDQHVVTVPATEIARAELGRPLPNAALLGGLAALTGVVTIDALCEAARATFPGPVGEANAAAARRAHDHVTARLVGGPA
jgi:pyruvate ferredoxin oxidoreductase gamma subunit